MSKRKQIKFQKARIKYSTDLEKVLNTTSAGCVWWISNVVSGHFSRIVELYKISIIPMVFGYNY